MKKRWIFGLTAIFTIALMANPVFAGPGCDAAKKDPTACAKICGIKTADKTDGKLIDAKADCDYKGKCETIGLVITGMKDTDSETSICKALAEQSGVIKVLSIDHTSGHAVVCFDPDKVESANLAKLVTDKGYKASVMTAAAFSETSEAKNIHCKMSAKAEEKKKENY